MIENMNVTVYPRVYGESPMRGARGRKLRGLSPRVRGIPGARRSRCSPGGSIPACTGNPRRPRAPPTAARVYPRVYGESSSFFIRLRSAAGLSPRVRGIPRYGWLWVQFRWSIPACTGNPRALACRYSSPAVYPRVYGESNTIRLPSALTLGLSPRVRGIPTGLLVPTDMVGSIPACTGNPGRAIAGAGHHRVYPRVYGESMSTRRSCRAIYGLSPRVRGIRHLPLVGAPAGGSIPACTGNPSFTMTIHVVREVYPRVYGESIACVLSLSRWMGSIPACTGNPRPTPTGGRRRWVYPRVYGESAFPQRRRPDRLGLSPRVRGIQRAQVAEDACKGSIPACTGNPSVKKYEQRLGGVYPRVYGESDGHHVVMAVCVGLSPRVRGIRPGQRPPASRSGSIPACTGNPYRASGTH